MRRNLSALAATILNGSLLGSGCEPPQPSGDEAVAGEPGGPVRKNPEPPRLTDDTHTQPYRPRGHGA